MIRSREMRWTGHLAQMAEMRNVYKIFIGKPEGKRLLQDLSVDGMVILKRILRKWDEKGGLD
jgi:hypothetical protein